MHLNIIYTARFCEKVLKALLLLASNGEILVSKLIRKLNTDFYTGKKVVGLLESVGLIQIEEVRNMKIIKPRFKFKKIVYNNSNILDMVSNFGIPSRYYRDNYIGYTWKGDRFYIHLRYSREDNTLIYGIFLIIKEKALHIGTYLEKEKLWESYLFESFDRNFSP